MMVNERSCRFHGRYVRQAGSYYVNSSGESVRIPSGVMTYVFVGSNESQCRRAVSGS